MSYEWVGQVIGAVGSAYASVKSAKDNAKIVGVQVRESIAKQAADAQAAKAQQEHLSALRAIELRAAQARAAVVGQADRVRDSASGITQSPWFWPGVTALTAALLISTFKGPPRARA